MFKNILFYGVPFVLCNLMAPEGAEGGGGDNPPPTPNPDPIPTEEPKPEGATSEAKLTSATGIISKLFSQLKSVHAKLQTATGQATKLQGQFDAATTEATRLKGELATMTTNRDTEKTRADSEKTRGDRADGNVARLESLCQLKGIDPNAVVPPAQSSQGNAQTGQAKWEKYNDLKKQETDGKAKPGTAMAYWKENKAELDKYAASLR